MKYALLFMVFIPAAVYAQGASVGNGKCKSSTIIKYEKMSMSQNYMTISKDGTGSVTFAGDEMAIDGPVVVNIDSEKQVGDKKLSKDWIVVADKVKICNTSTPAFLMAEALNYNNATQTGVLTGNITIVENGTMRTIGNRAVVDFRNDEYRIVSVQ